MRRTFPTFLLLALSGFAAAQETGIGDQTFPTLGNKGYKATHYLLKLNYDPGTNLLKGDVIMDAIATEGIKDVTLDFKGFEISAVKVNGKATTFRRSATKLVATSAEELPKDAKFTIETVYYGKPALDQSAALPAGLKSGWVSYPGGAVAACEPELAHTWFPCNDHPLNKATFEVDLTVPAGYTGISNGIGTKAGTAMKFVLDKPALTCMATVIVGKYATLKQPGPNNLPITNYVPLGSEAKFLQTLAAVPKQIQFLSEKLGPYPFSSYGCVMLPDGVGQASPLMSGAALETTTIPIYGGVSNSSDVLVHELAHQWMGDCVSVTNWGEDIWWVEGFAQYSEWLWAEAQSGKAAYKKLVDTTYQQVSSLPTWIHPGRLKAAEMFEFSYPGGALTFHALRVKLGDDKFYQTLREFVAKNKYGNASAKDWIEITSRISGQDMKPFFDEWLYGTKIPKLP